MNDSKKVIAVDCGGTNLRVALVDENLNIINVRRVPTVKGSGRRLFDTIAELIDEVASGSYIDAIGMSICGVVTHNRIGRCGNLGLDDGYDLVPLFNERYPSVPVRIANDANCSAFVEAKYGICKGLRDCGFITISSGIGFGLVHDGEMVDLPTEAGRLFTLFEGNYFETESLLSGYGLVKLAHHYGCGYIENSAQFFDEVRRGNIDAKKAYDEWVRRLGAWLANMQLLFNCEAYAVSGGVWHCKDVFAKDLAKIANAFIANWKFNPVVLLDAEYKQDVGICGAAAIALHELEK